MDPGKYEGLLYYFTTKKYPAGYNDGQKRCLRKSLNSFVVEDNRLYHIRDVRNPDDADEPPQLQEIVVGGPAEAQRIISEIHCNGTRGEHLGRKPTIEKVADTYWWPGYTVDVKEFIEKCEVCQRAKATASASIAATPNTSFEQGYQPTFGAGTSAPQTATNRSREVPDLVHGAKRQRVTASDGDKEGSLRPLQLLKKSVLLLQKQVLENNLQLQAEKKAVMTKLSLAADEYRRFVAEQRMIARGANVSHVPVDIPPGLEGLDAIE